MSLPEPLPLWLAVPAAALVVGAAWWTFGRPGAPRRRPWVVWGAGGAACLLVLWTQGFGYLLERDELIWWPVVAVGLAYGWSAARGRWRKKELPPGARRLLAAAAALLFSAPLFSVTAEVLRTRRETRWAVQRNLTGTMGEVWATVIEDVPGRVAIGGVCALVALAALRTARGREAPAPAPEGAP
ncbi:hypothetical protein [Alienimonas californiensis]|uniref:Uncharacterized protein n=1 Tax=Alienimonas californiensis TaxID=2527989 RepID=A0A517P8V0_9PLAN|nr:hypothetical protein [Alienimonas californiensis]QDT15791.1 hypothetical protein CA12_18850 [Alienimonas californiensis]